MTDEIEGIDSEQELVTAADTDTATELVTRLTKAPTVADAGLAIEELALACAVLDSRIKTWSESLDLLSARLHEAKKLLAAKFATANVSQVRVETPAGKKLVFLARVFSTSILAPNRPRMLEWLKKTHPAFVAEDYNDSSVKAFLKRTFDAKEGEFPQELVDAGVVTVYDGKEIRFRKN